MSHLYAHTHTHTHAYTHTHTHTHILIAGNPPSFLGGVPGGFPAGGFPGGFPPRGGFQTPRSRNSGPPNESTPTIFVPFWGFWKRVCTIAWGGFLRSTFSQLFAAHGIQFYLSQHTTHICAYTHTHTRTRTRTHTHAHTHTHTQGIRQRFWHSRVTAALKPLPVHVSCVYNVCVRACVWYDVMYRIASDA